MLKKIILAGVLAVASFVSFNVGVHSTGVTVPSKASAAPTSATPWCEPGACSYNPGCC